MTIEQFIQKWLGNSDYQYTEQNRDLMRNDLDSVCEWSKEAEQKTFICSPCNNCDGNGLIVGKSEMEECPICKGKGFIREQEKPAKESEPAKEIISEIICKECGKEGDLDLEGIWCANCQKYTYSEKPAKENIDLMGQIPIISLANSMFGKPTKEEREWKVGGMVRITKKINGQDYLEIGCEVEVVEYDAKDNTWWVEDVFCTYYGWITTEEAELIEK